MYKRVFQILDWVREKNYRIFMKNSKLVELLASFQATEFRQFREFVASPYFNKNEDLVQLTIHLEDLAPDFPAPAIKKERVYRALFPAEPFDRKKMAYLMNYLLKLAERFLAVQRYQQEETLINCHTLEQFVDRKLEKHYSYLFNKTGDSLQETDHQNGEGYYYQYLLAQLAAKHFYSKQVRKFDPSLQRVSDELDNYYFFNKLKYSCEMLNRQAILSADYHLTFVDEVKSYLLRQQEIDPLIQIYLHIYLSISFPEQESYFEVLMRLIEQHGSSVEQKLRREIYLYAINYCAPKIRKGEEKYLHIVLTLFVEGIANRSLFDEDYLSHWTYSNVVKLGLRLKRYEWVETFIKEHAVNLPPQLRADAEHYNLAELYYYKRDFAKVLEHLNLLHFTDLHYHLGSRVMLLKTYYEQDDVEPLLSLLASFSVYLRRNKDISAQMKKTYLNFCSLLHQLMRRNPKKWTSLGTAIRTTQPLTETAWLLQIWESQS